MKRSGRLLGMHIISFLLIAALSYGCSSGGGGGTGGNGGTTNQVTLSGTAASGKALAAATITLKDSAGHSRTATTANDGTYSFDTTGLTPPFLLLVTTTTNTTFYSVSADANARTTVNVTPLTDLIIRSWYDVQGVSMDAAFADPGANPPPSPTTVAVIGTVVRNVVQLWMNQAGVTAGSFNLISTPFAADGTGFDLVLDQTTVNPSTGDVTISGGGVTQNTTLTAAGGSINVVTTTTGTNGTSTSSNTTVVPVQTAQQTAIDEITTAFNGFANAVNTKGASLAVSDLLPFLDPNGVWGGSTRSQWAAQAVYALAGKTISFSGIAIKSLDGTLTAADTIFQLSESKGGQTSTSPQEFYFKKVNGAWLLSGDNRIANVEVRAEMAMSQGSSTGSQLILEANVDSPRSAPTITSLTSAAITGGPWNANLLSYNGQKAAPWDNTLISDSFGINISNPSISGGTLFTVVVTPTSGPTVTYTQAVNAITTEAIRVTNLTASSMADAHPGTPLTVNWTLPKTFAIGQIKVGTVAYSGPLNDPSTVKCDDMGEQVVLGTASTTAQVTIPATCNSVATAQAEIYLQVYGINGELSMVFYTFQ